MIKLLKKYGLQNKLSPDQLAKLLGVSLTTINGWFNGQVKPNQIQSYHIQKLLDTKL